MYSFKTQLIFRKEERMIYHQKYSSIDMATNLIESPKFHLVEVKQFKFFFFLLNTYHVRQTDQ